MSYLSVCNTIKAVAEAVNPDGFYQHGTTWAASLNFSDGDPQIYLYPISATSEKTNGYYEAWNVVMGFFAQDAQDSTPLEQQAILHNMDILRRLFEATIEPVEGLEISNTRFEPRYRNMAGTYTGWNMSFTFGTTTDLCTLTVDDIIIPPAQTLCEAIRACVGNVQSIEFNGDGTNSYVIPEIDGKTRLLVSTDGRIRKFSDYNKTATTDTLTFISNLQVGQKGFILYK